MNKICVYTCITGDYDVLKILNFPDKNFDYICFTNNKKITSDFWKVIYISEDLDNLTLARKIKILGHEELEKYDLTIWLDGAMQLRKPLSTFLKECCDLKKYDMIGFKHRERDCIYDELNACVSLFKETIENASNLEKFLRENNYPEHNGLIESTVLVRKNNSHVDELMQLWFDMLCKFSRRDQLSFNYCLWKKTIKINMLNMNVFDNDYFVHQGHLDVGFSKKFRIYFENPTGFNYKSYFDLEYKKVDDFFVADTIVPFDCNKINLMVSPYDCVLVSEIKADYDFCVNSILIDKHNFFVRYSGIIFSGCFKKNDRFIVYLKIDPVDIKRVIGMYNDEILEYKEKVSELKKENFDLKQSVYSFDSELDKVLNSKGWKFLQKIRKILK